jgi:hypothetical protein
LLFPGPPPKGKGGKGFDPLLSPGPPPKGKGGKGFDPSLFSGKGGKGGKGFDPSLFPGKGGKGGKGFDPSLFPGKGGKGFDSSLFPGKGGKGFDPLLSLGPLPFPGNGKGPLWAFAIVNKTNNDNNKTKGNNFMEAILFDCININIYKKRYKTEMKYNITIY